MSNKKTNKQHTYHAIQSCDRLIYLAPVPVVVRVTEALTPVAEVGRDDEQVLRFCEIASENTTVRSLSLWTQRAHQHWHYCELIFVPGNPINDKITITN